LNRKRANTPRSVHALPSSRFRFNTKHEPPRWGGYTAVRGCDGRSQAVRLPQEFRFEGDRVRIRRIDHGVILEPLIPDAAKWFDEMDRFNQEQFMGKRRNQPITPRREIFK